MNKDSMLSSIEWKTLCEQFGVAIYRVGDVYSHDKSGNPIAETDLEKFFVSIPTTSEFNLDVIHAIPLADTQEEAEAFAVEYLNWKALKI